ncbi:MAG: hypothetical protein LBF16_04825 [Pseudomonadales bacterium]|jgi:hypothetical protein|nr:hypothetical protein [Pseudomonadales bacterium]
MSLDSIEVVDAVGTDSESGAVVLSIIDDWDWIDERKHLLALQDKLNAYLGFVESGQIYDSYPDASGRPLRINVISKFPPPQAALIFLDKASAVAAQLNMAVAHQITG